MTQGQVMEHKQREKAGRMREGGRKSDEVREEGRDEENVEEVMNVGEDRALRRR